MKSYEFAELPRKINKNCEKFTRNGNFLEMFWKKKTFEKIGYTFGFLFNGIFSLLFQNIFNTILIVRFSYFSVLSHAIFLKYLLAKWKKPKIVVSTATEITINRIDFKVNSFPIIVFFKLYPCLFAACALILLFPVLFSFFFSVQIILTRKASFHKQRKKGEDCSKPIFIHNFQAPYLLGLR
jgi:hypothetical protein